MKYFQDILHQTLNQCGALWCDEGVYRLAKEMKGSGVDSIFTNNRVFGSGVVTNVLDGGHYTRGILWLTLQAEKEVLYQWINPLKNHTINLRGKIWYNWNHVTERSCYSI